MTAQGDTVERIFKEAAPEEWPLNFNWDEEKKPERWAFQQESNSTKKSKCSPTGSIMMEQQKVSVAEQSKL